MQRLYGFAAKKLLAFETASLYRVRIPEEKGVFSERRRVSSPSGEGCVDRAVNGVLTERSMGR
jgi:hypothetical protein